MRVVYSDYLENLKNKYGKDYIIVIGTICLGNEILSADEIYYKIKCNYESESNLLALLSSLSGFYSIVIYIDNKLYIIGDVVRTYPLFYSCNDGVLSISEFAEDLVCVNKEFDNLIARDQFLHSGYCLENTTLYNGVFQTEAGKILILKNNNISETICYKFWSCNDNKNKINYELVNKILDRALDRLIDYASGRQIIVPLSGGYDSRLIVLKLKEKGYTNVICYTYGRSNNNPEMVLSKKIAEQLNFKWIFLEYTDENIKKMWKSKDAEIFKSRYSNFCSLPVIQDWFAVNLMKKGSMVEEDAIFVPGHTGDFVSGNHIPAHLFLETDKIYSLEDIVNYIFDKHFTLVPLIDNKISYEIKKTIKKQLQKINSHMSQLNYKDFASYYECWVWSERQTKYIVNSIQVYKQYGYNWWLPLWDKEYVDFCLNMPIEYRKNRNFIVGYTEYLYNKIVDTKTSITLGNANSDNLVKVILMKLANVFPEKIKVKLIYLYRFIINKNKKHRLAFDALISKKDYIELRKEGYNLLGIYAKFFLDGKW